MAPVKVDPARVHGFETAAAFEAWLREHHASEPEVWIRVPKKHTGLPTVSMDQAIDAALCWGWIDAIRKGQDETYFLQRFTPRGAKSVWSQVNVDKVARLTAEGRMTAHGLAHVEAAKADGRWDRAYSIRDAEPPADLIQAIEAEPDARRMWDGLSAQNRFAFIFRLGQLKTEAGRRKRIAASVDMLKRGETFHPQKARP